MAEALVYAKDKMSKAEIDAAFHKWKWRIFVTLWITYGSFYLCRANLSSVIPALLDEYGWSKTEMGVITSALFFTYAIGQFVNGQLGDRYGARRLVTIGMVVSAVANIVMSLQGSILGLAIVWGINGYFQSMGWGPCVKTLANWFTPKERGRWSGFFGSCYQIGNAVSWFLAGWLVGNVGWRFAFWIPAVLFLVSAAHFYLRVRNSPESIGLPTLEEYSGVMKAEEAAKTDEHLGFGWTLRRTVGNVRVWMVGASFFCLDIIRYGFFTWAPTYMVETQGAPVTAASWKAIVLPIFGSLGAIFSGWATDKWFGSRRAPVIAIELGLLGFLSIVFRFLPIGAGLLSLVILAAIGFCTYGPHVLMVGTVAMDFGTRKGAASAAGFIDFLGYSGAFIQGPLTGFLVDNYGWDAGFIFWIGAAFLAAILMGTQWTFKPKEEKYV